MPAPKLSRSSRFCAALVFCLSAAAAIAQVSQPYQGLMLDGCRVGGAVFAAGERGRILRSDDSGTSWEIVSTPTNATLTSITFVDTHRGWAVGHDGTIIHTNDGAITWSAQSEGIEPETSFLDICAPNVHSAVAVGAFGVCYVTTDAGRKWTRRQVLDEELHLNRISADEKGTFFLAGEQGLALKLLDLKSDAVKLETGYDGSLNGILTLQNGELLAYGLRGHAYRSGDGGASWTQIGNLPPSSLNTALEHSSGVVFIAGQARVFLKSVDGGKSFSALPSPVTWAVSELVEAPNGTVLLLGEGGIVRFLPDVPAEPTGASKSP